MLVKEMGLSMVDSCRYMGVYKSFYSQLQLLTILQNVIVGWFIELLLMKKRLIDQSKHL